MSAKTNFNHQRVAILATHGFEQSELVNPMQALEHEGVTVDVVSIDDNQVIMGWDETDWGDSVCVDKQVLEADINDYDAMILPGGQINPDALRDNDDAVDFIRQAHESDKIKAIAAICHGPWLLIEAGLVDGKKITSFPSIKTDIVNAGGNWLDEPVVCDGKLITSRNPNDLDNFNQAILNKLES